MFRSWIVVVLLVTLVACRSNPEPPARPTVAPGLPTSPAPAYPSPPPNPTLRLPNAPGYPAPEAPAAPGYPAPNLPPAPSGPAATPGYPYPAAPPPASVSQPPVAVALPTPTPLGAAGNTIALTFVSSQQGWVLTTDCKTRPCPVRLATTSDGGQTWQTLSAPGEGRLAEDGTSGGISGLLFVSPTTGWAYGPTLSTTRDGGQTWREEKTGGETVALVKGDKTVWRLERQCPTGTGAGAPTCAFSLWGTANAGQTWQRVGSETVQGQSAQLVRAGDQVAWLRTGRDVTGGVRLTRDGGQTWTDIPLPCAALALHSLAAADPDHVWAVCTGSPATAQQAKSVYTSADAGQLWTLVADAALPGQPGLNNLPLAGYARGIVPLSVTQAFLPLGRATLLGTRDGGKTWQASLPPDEGNSGDAGIGPLQFVDGQAGWLAQADRLFRTRDGGATWQKVLLP